jgi:hypothetical protein
MSPEQANRMMEVWAKIEAATAENTNLERVCWYITVDGTGGFTVSKASDADAASAFELEVSLALSEFLELRSDVVLDLETAMPAIEKGMARINS